VQPWPPAPQAVSAVPASQLTPLQQPEPQSFASQPAMHAWLLQILAFAEQFTHSAAPVPQALSAVPTSQLTPLQQPEPQSFASQPATHAWLLQTSAFPEQFTHPPPPVLQAVSLVPGWQLPFPSQQPFGQVTLSQPAV
jgi:hypothetical protein